jgi:transcriptional regulator with XRE-family HTH domain
MPLGSFLRELRKSQRLTLETVSQQAGISRVTLNRWETDVCLPRLPELEAVLRVLGASAKQCSQALTLLNAPRARAAVQEKIARLADQKDLGEMPQRGTLLRVMRLRRRLSQEELAAQIGISPRTLHRWETSETQPTVEQIHAFCFAVGAHEEEVIALTVGRFATHDFSPASLEELKARLEQLGGVYRGRPPVQTELHYLMLKSEIWQRALRSIEGQQMLSLLVASYGMFLHHVQRNAEAAHYGMRALDLLPSGSRLHDRHIIAGTLAVVCPALSRNRSFSKNQISDLKFWMDKTESCRDLEGWMLAFSADSCALKGDYEEALRVNQLALDSLERHSTPFEVRARKWDRARYLTRMGRAEEALAWLPLDPNEAPNFRAMRDLILAEVYLTLKQWDAAQDVLQQITVSLTEHELEHLRSDVNRLAALLEM